MRSPRKVTLLSLFPLGRQLALEAYDLYLRGRNLLEATNFNLRPSDNLNEAARLFGEAVARDPSFVVAYCQLARAHDHIYFIEADHTQQRLELAKAAIGHAFRIRPDSGEAHLALSHHLYITYRDYDGALSELEIARRSLPNGTAHICFHRWHRTPQRRMGEIEAQLRACAGTRSAQLGGRLRSIISGL